MKRIFFVCTMLLTAALCLEAQSDSVLTLAQILAGKGTISAAELAHVEAADQSGRLQALAQILSDKGILSSSELARLSMPGSTAVASAAPVAPPSATPSAATTETQNVTTRKGLPVSIYGTLLTTMGYNTAPFNIVDTPMIASKQGSDPTGGDKNFYGSARQTRLGMTLNPVDVLGGTLTGAFEFDLFGGEAEFTNGIHFDLLRERLAYGRVDWQHFAVEAGQDWTIFAPLNPTSLNEFGIPEMTATGNAWTRSPQFRFEAKTTNASGNNVLLQIAATDPNEGDNSTTVITTARQPGIGERGRMPALESRLAFTKTHDDRKYTIAASSHYNRGKNAGTVGTATIQQPVDSWGVAVDYSLPFSKFVALTGEAYEGRALGIYSIASGESVGAVRTLGGHGVLSRGGWSQLQFNLNKQWQVNLAYGVDQPDDKELPVGNRSRNQQYMANVIDRLTKNISASLEYRRILTDYRNQLSANERGDHVDLGIAYIF